MIGGRPISTIQLWEPIRYKEWSIACVELPCPKAGSYYAKGWEHFEVVIADRGHSCAGTEEILMKFVGKYPSISFDMRAAGKEVNADVSVSVCGDSVTSVKFHCAPLYDVIAFELSQHGAVVSVPGDYFDGVE